MLCATGWVGAHWVTAPVGVSPVRIVCGPAARCLNGGDPVVDDRALSAVLSVAFVILAPTSPACAVVPVEEHRRSGRLSRRRTITLPVDGVLRFAIYANVPIDLRQPIYGPARSDAGAHGAMREVCPAFELTVRFLGMPIMRISRTGREHVSGVGKERSLVIR